MLKRKSMIGMFGLTALLVGSLLCVMTVDSSADPKFLYVKSQAANIRATPSIQGEILKTVSFGAQLYSMDHIGDWYQIKLEEGKIGFIYDELVTDDHPEQLFVEANMANIRELNNVYSPVVTVVKLGTELKSLQKKDDWYQVKTADGTTGWIYEDLVDHDPPGILFVKVMSARVHASCSPMSEVLAEVSAGTELKKMMKIEDFYQVQLADERTGFIYKKSVTDDTPERLFVDTPQAEVKTDPTIYGVVAATVTAGTELVAFDKEDDFYLVRTPDGTLGWIYDDNVIEMGHNFK